VAARGIGINVPALVFLTWSTLTTSLPGAPQPTNDAQELQLVVHPAPEPRPALRYRLLPPPAEQIAGNAAVYYGKATAQQHYFFADRELDERFWQWSDLPLEDLRKQGPASAPRIPDSIWSLLKRAALCKYCDWQVPPDASPTVLDQVAPELQQARSFARRLRTRARRQILEGDLDGAIETLQVTYALARHLSTGETIFHPLVACSISLTAFHTVVDLMQQPNAPNLYWALTVLPRPFIDVRAALEHEAHTIYRLFPQLLEASRHDGDTDYWNRQLHAISRHLASISQTDSNSYCPSRTDLLLRILARYPEARRTLIEQGIPVEEVDRMPAARLAILYTRYVYEQSRDRLLRLAYLPYWQVRPTLRQEAAQLVPELRRREILPVSRLLPAVWQPLEISARCDQQIALLRLIEALRMYAAANGGRLPTRLSDLPVPAPLDPATNKPFGYQVRDGAGIITCTPLAGGIRRVELRILRD